MAPEERQQVIDTEHLRLLELFHYISGAITIAFSCLFLVQLAFMLSITWAMPQFDKHGAPIPPFPIAAFAIILGLLTCLGIALGVMQIVSGRCIAHHKRRLLSIIVAVPLALMMPFGTILAVMTWLVLTRASVQTMYVSPTPPG